MTLDLRRMMLLCDLAELGSVAAVAEQRRVTSSAVSQQLRALEHDTGAVLFRRDGRTLGMTRTGEVLVQHVRKVLSALDEAETAIAAARTGVLGNIAVASFNMGIPMLVAPMMSRLRLAHPDLNVALQQESAEHALRLLRRSELDIAILCRYPFDAPHSAAGLIDEHLMDEPMVLLAPLDQHDRIRAEGIGALAESPWVTGPVSSGLSTTLGQVAGAAGFVPKVKHRVIGAQNLCMLAATEVASAIAPRMAVPAEFESLIVRDVGFAARTISAVVRHNRQRDPNIKLVLRELHDVVAANWPETQRRPLRVAV
ncbi:LysR family transcriptional regulator [Nocardia sp. NPDC058176]|uniref:LysR family transcriptional regulator n=1 Tax=Nocardia sp. NPDC058176 TaxID=3346368 RepID=UPI0036DF5234